MLFSIKCVEQRVEKFPLLTLNCKGSILYEAKKTKQKRRTNTPPNTKRKTGQETTETIRRIRKIAGKPGEMKREPVAKMTGIF